MSVVGQGWDSAPAPSALPAGGIVPGGWEAAPTGWEGQ